MIIFKLAAIRRETRPLVSESLAPRDASLAACRHARHRTAGEPTIVGCTPALAIAASGFGLSELRTGLLLAAGTFGLTQLLVTALALKRSTLTTPRRVALFFAELLLCLLVVAIKVVSH